MSVFFNNEIRISKLMFLQEQIEKLRKKRIILDCDTPHLSQEDSNTMVKLIAKNPFIQYITIIWADSAKIKILDKITTSIQQLYRSMPTQATCGIEEEQKEQKESQIKKQKPFQPLLKGIKLELSLYRQWNPPEMKKCLCKVYSLDIADLSICIKLRKEFLQFSYFFEIMPKPQSNELRSFEMGIEQTGIVQAVDFNFFTSYIQEVVNEQKNLQKLSLRVRINSFIMPKNFNFNSLIHNSIREVGFDFSEAADPKSFFKLINIPIIFPSQSLSFPYFTDIKQYTPQIVIPTVTISKQQDMNDEDVINIQSHFKQKQTSLDDGNTTCCQSFPSTFESEYNQKSVDCLEEQIDRKKQQKSFQKINTILSDEYNSEDDQEGSQPSSSSSLQFDSFQKLSLEPSTSGFLKSPSQQMWRLSDISVDESQNKNKVTQLLRKSSKSNKSQEESNNNKYQSELNKENKLIIPIQSQRQDIFTLSIGRLGSLTQQNVEELKMFHNLQQLEFKNLYIKLIPLLRNLRNNVTSLRLLHCDLLLPQSKQEIKSEEISNLKSLKIECNNRLSDKEEMSLSMVIGQFKCLEYLNLVNVVLQLQKQSISNQLQTLKLRLIDAREQDINHIHSILDLFKSKDTFQIFKKGQSPNLNASKLLQKLSLKVNIYSWNASPLFKAISKIPMLNSLHLEFGSRGQPKILTPEICKYLKMNYLLSKIHIKFESNYEYENNQKTLSNFLSNNFPNLTSLDLGDQQPQTTQFYQYRCSSILSIISFNHFIVNFLPLNPAAVLWDLYEK